MVPRRGPSGAESDLVDCSVFAPPEVPGGAQFLVQVFAHTFAQAEEAAGLARGYDEDARARGSKGLEVEVERGSRLHFHLELAGLTLDRAVETLVWRGRPGSVQFVARTPVGHPIGDLIGRLTIGLGGIPVGFIAFKLKVVGAGLGTRVGAGPVGDSSHRFRRAFISYASPDRPEVLKRLQMLRFARIRYFQDLLDLEPGDRWERKLYRRIDRCDLFLLFWSTAASRSDWVLKEARYALDRGRGVAGASPEIRPVIIEGPPVPDPPPDLSHLHFNDWLIHLIDDGPGGTRPAGSA